MKHWQRSWRHTNLAIMSLVFGLVVTGAGVRLWLRAMADSAGAADHPVAVVAILFGVFVAICAGHEIWRARVQ